MGRECCTWECNRANMEDGGDFLPIFAVVRGNMDRSTYPASERTLTLPTSSCFVRRRQRLCSLSVRLVCAMHPWLLVSFGVQVCIEIHPKTLAHHCYSNSISAIRTIKTESLTFKDAQSILNKQRLHRPSSPHFTIYKPQIPWILSIATRVTGAGLSVGTLC